MRQAGTEQGPEPTSGQRLAPEKLARVYQLSKISHSDDWIVGMLSSLKDHCERGLSSEENTCKDLICLPCGWGVTSSRSLFSHGTGDKTGVCLSGLAKHSVVKHIRSPSSPDTQAGRVL